MQLVEMHAAIHPTLVMQEANGDKSLTTDLWCVTRLDKITEHESISIYSCDVNSDGYCSEESDIDDVVSCNGICDLADCSEEAYCNGFHCGIRYQKSNTTIYVNVKPVRNAIT